MKLGTRGRPYFISVIMQNLLTPSMEPVPFPKVSHPRWWKHMKLGTRGRPYYEEFHQCNHAKIIRIELTSFLVTFDFQNGPGEPQDMILEQYPAIYVRIL